MASKQFVSARIPEELLAQLESHAEATGESKSSILVEALTEYLNPRSPSDKENFNTEERIRHFENWINNRITTLEARIDSLEDLRNLREELKALYTAIQEKNSAHTLPAVSKNTQKRLMPTSSC